MLIQPILFALAALIVLVAINRYEQRQNNVTFKVKNVDGFTVREFSMFFSGEYWEGLSKAQRAGYLAANLNPGETAVRA